MLEIKNIVKLEIFVIIQVNIEVLHICNLKYSVPKEIYTVFHNGSNYDYNFVIKSLAEEFEGQFTCLKENAEWRMHNLFSSSRKRNFLIGQDLRQAHYQILSIISLKESIKLNVNTVMKIKNAQRLQLNTKIVSAVLNRKTLKMIK